MRLLFVSQDFPPDLGGIQTYTAELAGRLAVRSDAFRLVVPKRPGSEAFDAGLDYPVTRLPVASSALVTAAAAALPRLARRERYDVAFHAQWLTVGASLAARRLTGYPRRIVVAAHGRETLFTPWPGPLAPLYDAGRRRSFRAADRVLPVSRYSAGLVGRLGVPAERLTVVPNGTDPTRFAVADGEALRRKHGLDGRRIVLGLGRLVARKGYDTTIRALPRVAEAVPDVAYAIVGEGPDRPRLEAMAEALGVADRVHFLGGVPFDEPVGPYYALGHVYAMPARSEPPDVEGFGIVFLEANACGLPVVGVRDGGVPDAVVHGETGLLVPPSDPEALAEALVELLADPEKARRMGEAGRRRVLDGYTWDHVAERIAGVLREVHGG